MKGVCQKSDMNSGTPLSVCNQYTSGDNKSLCLLKISIILHYFNDKRSNN